MMTNTHSCHRSPIPPTSPPSSILTSGDDGGAETIEFINFPQGYLYIDFFLIYFSLFN